MEINHLEQIEYIFRQTLHRLESRAAGNRRLAKKRVQCLNEVLCFVSSSVLADSFVLRNPLLRQAPNRYMPLYDNRGIRHKN